MREETPPPMARLRLVFEDRHILSKSQRLKGLHRSWLLLSPQRHATIHDVATHVLSIFTLRQSCPNGLLLFMDGFALPPFESTSILKDNDIISVKRMQGAFSGIAGINGESNSLEGGEIVEKQPIFTGVKFRTGEEFEEEIESIQSEYEKDKSDFPHGNALGSTGNFKNGKAPRNPIRTGVKLLANEEFEKETRSYQCEPEEDFSHAAGDISPVRNANSKKRKAPKKLESSRRKKKCPAYPEDVGNDSCAKKRENSRRNKISMKKSSPKKRKMKSSAKSKPDADSPPANSERSIDSMPSPDMGVGLQEIENKTMDASNLADGGIKIPSRSARRKKAKRKWLRELAKAEKIAHAEKMAKVEKKVVNEGQTLDNVTIDHEQQEKGHEKEDEVIPVVVRPGHIRFEPIGEERVVQQNPVPVENLHWNGITSKRKGQKWGTEKFSSRRSNYEDFQPECLEMAPLAEVITVNEPVDFDKLRPLVCLPKEGDLIAYRLLELSSVWTPEPSSFRVGKVLSYDPESYKIVLIPVPEYPVVFEKSLDEDGPEGPVDSSRYKEDGSLEANYTELIDVRIIELGHSHPSESVSNGACPGIEDAVLDAPAKVNNKDWGAPSSGNSVAVINNQDLTAPSSGNGGVNAWDEIRQVLTRKKVELSQENGCSKKDSSDRSTGGPYRARQRNALGPLVTLLRSNNDL